MARYGDWDKYTAHVRAPYNYIQDDSIFCCLNEPLTGPPHAVLGEKTPSFNYTELTKEVPRHTFRLLIYRCISNLSDEELQWELSDHRVNHHALASHTQKIPRYLFRVWNDKSAGVNKLLAKALQLLENGHEDLHIGIIDTWKLGPGAYIFHAEALLRAYRVEQQLVYPNMEDSMVLVWKELKAPMATISLANFLRDGFQKGRLQPGYLTLQPFHHRPLDDQFAKIYSKRNTFVLDQLPKARTTKIDRKSESRPTGIRKAFEIRKKIYTTESIKAFLVTVLERQAPKLYRKHHRATRLRQGIQGSRRNLENFRVPLAWYEFDDFAEFVKRHIDDIDFQWPMLMFFLSTRTKEFETDSIIETIAEWGRDDPMFQAHQECIVRDLSSSALPEITSFEKLLQDSCEALGIPLVEKNSFRKFWVLHSPHTEVPELQEKSEFIAHIIDGKERKRQRLESEAAERDAKEKALREREERRARALEESIQRAKAAQKKVNFRRDGPIPFIPLSTPKRGSHVKNTRSIAIKNVKLAGTASRLDQHGLSVETSSSAKRFNISEPIQPSTFECGSATNLSYHSNPYFQPGGFPHVDSTYIPQTRKPKVRLPQLSHHEVRRMLHESYHGGMFTSTSQQLAPSDEPASIHQNTAEE